MTGRLEQLRSANVLTSGSSIARQDMEFDQATGLDPYAAAAARAGAMQTPSGAGGYSQRRPSATQTNFQQAKALFEVRAPASAKVLLSARLLYSTTLHPFVVRCCSIGAHMQHMEAL